MKTKLFLFFTLICVFANSQTTISMDADLSVANYDAAFYEDGDAGFWYNATALRSQLWTYENGDDAIANAVVWKNFTDDGTTSGTPITMAVGDSFKTTIQYGVSATGDIGVALLSSPSTTASYADIDNNYAVQLNINGTDNLWEVVSDGGTVTATSITGGTAKTTSFEIVFTLDTATTMTVSISSSDEGKATKSITLNNTDITGFSAYVNNNGAKGTGSMLFIEAPMNFVHVFPLGIDDGLPIDLPESTISVNYYDGKIHIKGIDLLEDYTLTIYDMTGSEEGTPLTEEDSLEVAIGPGFYFVRLETASGLTISNQLIVQ